MDDMELWSQMTEQSKRKTIIIEEGQQKVMDSDNYSGRPVIGKIVVLPRSALEKFECDKTWACISILDSQPPSENVLKAFREAGKTYVGDMPKISDANREALLTVRFDDIEFERPGKKQIDAEQANEIVRFVDEFWNEVDLLMVHCTAGISRSTAVAKAISDKYQPEWSGIFDQLYQPNTIVHNVVRKALNE